jgi:hypothetical protein
MMTAVRVEQRSFIVENKNTVECGYNIRWYDISPVASDILWYQLIPHC